MVASPSASSSGGVPAGYGRSCINCSKAKCKCIMRADGQDCERCHRLSKDCQPMTTSRKRHPKKSASSRTAQLENKIDDLVSILRASQQNGTSPTSVELSGICQPSRLDSLAHAATTSSSYASSTSASGSALITTTHDPDGLPEPTPAEAEIYLLKFRAWLHNFPFLVLDPEYKAADMRRDRPFLWLCIMNITSMSVSQQAAMKDRVRQQIAQRIVMNSERSIDVLLGIIVYMAWATLNNGPGSKPFLVLFAQMGTTLAYELGLTRSTLEDQNFATCFKTYGGRHTQRTPRTMEERRAVLALWYLTSTCSFFIGRMDSLPWTSHMDECLDILDREQEQVTDKVFVTLVRLQLLKDEAQKLMVKDVMAEANGTPTFVFRKGLLRRLQESRDYIQSHLPTNICVQAEFHGTSAMINAVGIFAQAQQGATDTQRIESMYSCARACRDWIELYFSIPIEDLPGLPFAVHGQLFQLHMQIYKLYVCDDPDWDRDALRSIVDLFPIMDRAAERYLQVATIYPVKMDEGREIIFAKAAKLLRNLKATWEPSVAQHLNGLPTPDSQSQMASAAGTAGAAVEQAPVADPNLMLDPASLDFSDIAWMSDIYGPWEF